MTLADFIQHLRDTQGIAFGVEKVAYRPVNPMAGNRYITRHFAYTITLAGARRMAGYLSQGSAHTKDPTLGEVLDSLAHDCEDIYAGQTCGGWAAGYGYDPKSAAIKRLYRACVEVAEDLRAFLGDSLYDMLLGDVERL